MNVQSFMLRLVAPFMIGVVMNSVAYGDEFSQWLKTQNQISHKRLIENISPPEALKGAIIASPSRQDPDYYFHWIRDAGIVVGMIVDEIKMQAPENPMAHPAFKHIDDFVDFTHVNQKSAAPSGLGEPKFLVNGQPYTGPWARPQNDGPALRALALSRMAGHLIQTGQRSYVLSKLYNPDSARTVIRADLEYLIANVGRSNFDLWEEIRGQHFYTNMNQFSAFVEAMKLARAFNDRSNYERYRGAAERIAEQLQMHWDAEKQVLVPTIKHDGGIGYKVSGLDTSIVLAVLHTKGKGLIGFDNDMLLSTIVRLNIVFKQIYHINNSVGSPGIAIGRYPEDEFYGGNPWILTTAAFAEFYFELANTLLNKKRIVLTKSSRDFYAQIVKNDTLQRQVLDPSRKSIEMYESIFKDIVLQLGRAGDSYLMRIKYHTPSDRSFSEQFDRNNGYMKSARDLTWSYAAFITATIARQNLIQTEHIRFR